MSQYDPTDLQGQRKAQEQTAQKRRLSKDNERDDIKWLMGSRRGRRIIWRQLDRAGVFRLSFNTNAMAMAFAEGNRNEGLYILDMIHRTCPELYQTMVSEANERRNHPDDGTGHNDH